MGQTERDKDSDNAGCVAVVCGRAVVAATATATRLSIYRRASTWTRVHACGI